MIPLQVIEEVDAKKHGGSGRNRQIARDLLPWIEGLLGTGTGPVPTDGRDETMVEMLPVDYPHHRPSAADEEILDAYDDVRLLIQRAVLVTGDAAMRSRARAQNIYFCSMPDRYLRVTS